ncbi:helix-turn-helix domain-containing protein [Fodinicola acaciae]|uniref:helix-turn-helix domain-containing protein n=1 Tax=Fodinicola acaciae TaxID=2681555 RepID=UPI0013D19E4A|nr:helix-turn-helix transcriptional regulator [Fodinicola acaciae]
MRTEEGGTVPMRQLGRELRRLREASPLTIEEVFEHMEWSRQKVWRVERGDTRASSVEVEALCRLFGADERTTEGLVALAKAAKTKGWYYAYGDVIPEWFELYVGLETAATSLQEYSAELIPGPLQTADYARALLRFAANGGEREVERKVELRVARKQRLTVAPDALRVDYVVSETAIRRPTGGQAVMTEQLRELLKLSELDNVSIRILPQSVGIYGAMIGSFAILTFPAETEPDTVYVEALTGALYLVKPKELAAYRQEFESLRSVALDRGKSRDFLTSAVKDLSSG